MQQVYARVHFRFGCATIIVEVAFAAVEEPFAPFPIVDPIASFVVYRLSDVSLSRTMLGPVSWDVAWALKFVSFLASSTDYNHKRKNRIFKVPRFKSSIYGTSVRAGLKTHNYLHRIKHVSIIYFAFSNLIGRKTILNMTL